MMILGQLQGKHAMLIMLVCLLAAFLPGLITWLFGSKLISDDKMSKCASSLLMKSIKPNSQARTPGPHHMMRMQDAMPSVTGRGMPYQPTTPPAPAPMPGMPDMYQTGDDFMSAFD